MRRLGLVSFLLLIPLASFGLTLSQLITNTRILIQDASSNTRQRFPDSTYTQVLNEAQQSAIEQTRCLRQSTNFTLAQGTTYYSLPSNFLTIERVTVGSKYLQEMTPAALDGRSRGWEYASGYPTYYFLNFSTPTSIGFAPFPQTSTDTDTVKVEYDVLPTNLSAGTDVPFNNVGSLYDYHDALQYYAAAVLSTIDNQPQRAQNYMPLYTSEIAQMAKRCLSRPSYLPSATGSP